MSALTENAAAFVAANAASPVVSGAVIFEGAERPENVRGVRYALANGKRFELTSGESHSIQPPRWQI